MGALLPSCLRFWGIIALYLTSFCCCPSWYPGIPQNWSKLCPSITKTPSSPAVCPGWPQVHVTCISRQHILQAKTRCCALLSSTSLLWKQGLKNPDYRWCGSGVDTGRQLSVVKPLRAWAQVVKVRMWAHGLSSHCAPPVEQTACTASPGPAAGPCTYLKCLNTASLLTELTWIHL